MSGAVEADDVQLTHYIPNRDYEGCYHFLHSRLFLERNMGKYVYVPAAVHFQIPRSFCTPRDSTISAFQGIKLHFKSYFVSDKGVIEGISSVV